MGKGRDMKEYDVIVIGSGSGLSLVHKALSEKARVALVAREYLGGTCLNVGCVPSKLLIYPADRIMEIEDTGKLGITAPIKGIDFSGIMERMRAYIQRGVSFLREDTVSTENLDFYEAEGHFIGDYTLQVHNETIDEQIRGRKIFIASGTRPLISPVKGLQNVDYLTNETLLSLQRLPESVLVLGGSYIGVEYAHFFSAMGSKVTIVERLERLVAFEEPEISDLLKKEMEKRMTIYTGTTAIEARKKGSGVALLLKEESTGQEKEVAAERLLVAAGRVSNAGRLDLPKTGVETDRAGFIKVDNYLQTSKEHIWAVGDATGKQMFTHAADKEVEVAWHNATHEEKTEMNFAAVPHAVYSYPQIASIGLTEAEARKTYQVLVGKANYNDVVQGDARIEKDGFAKAIIERDTGRILGFHIIGPEASVLIQEVVNAVVNKAGVDSITDSMHTFPSMSELIPETLNRAE
ncbi:MAG TPA: dihydrolipoyl dehydrogenase [Syntrophorhabdales bacterium]|nr:dihydrolipoyl dehydrogenase [Syntrophorhabdales bacterium]